ncbi:MAG: PSD1 and planctomycete cytochrome C domain-containing protein [Verrucomicrobiales bacterium]|nr:PSD1 and planctomycete cytochrome C domain-containing protein [Verrucomicrobiales bacterium]
MKRFVVISSLGFVAGILPVAAEVDFVNEIQPIFAEKCTLCHGPDDKKAGLRLTSIEFASQELKSGEKAIVPGDVLASHLLARIHSEDPDEVMPPPDKAEPLTAKEKEKLEQWIAEGADWPKHWAYRELASFDSGKLSEGQSAIDFFISEKLREKTIEPSPPADDITLIRRLFYDLIGLPPTPEQVADHLPRFQKNRNEALDRLVSDLLASRHFGERWGRHWLDHARYADSDGYEKDNNRMNAWRYRDWVINAFNADLPFDQFTIEQFAGDLLPDRSEDQLLATAFNRQTLTNTEGGTDKEQWRVAAVMDRVETTGTVWLGLTVGCARCHTHKYDEITVDEYYELFAYFNNGDETAQKLSAPPADVERWKTALAGKQTQLEEAKKLLTKAEADLLPRIPELVAETKQKLAAASEEEVFAPLPIQKMSGPKGVTLTQNKEDQSVLVGGTSPDSGTYRIEGEIPAGMQITGFKLEVLPDDSLPSGGPGRVEHGNFVLNQLVFQVGGKPQPFGDAEATHSQEKTWKVTGAIDDNVKPKNEGSGWAIGPQYGKANHAVFGLVHPVQSDKAQKYIIALVQNYGTKHMIGKFRLSVLTSPTRLVAPPELRNILTKNQPAGTQQDSAPLSRFYSRWDPSVSGLKAKVARLEAELPGKPEMDIRVLTERETDRRRTHVFRRGEFKEPLHEVSPGTFASLPAVEHRGEHGDRLDFAKWLVSGENPLPPRVIVNRIWGHLFGEGIVRTVNDFGVRGDRPTHPELLDWLASEFIQNGWSRKKLIREIVSSGAYQRSSAHRQDLVDIDPKNHFLARQNRFRVEAEIVRDISLSAAGLLSQKTGGPSVFPLIPPGVTDANYNSAFKWVVSPGEDRFRRGLYTFFKRTAPHPNLMTFDCPDSNVTNVKRTRSNTPLAALITLNNETFTESAQALAARVLREVKEESDAARLERAFHLCLSRAPEDPERERLASLLENARSYYRDNGQDALAFAGANLPEGVSAEEAASWAATVRVILNLDEFLTRG